MMMMMMMILITIKKSNYGTLKEYESQNRTHRRQKSEEELLREELGDVINPNDYKYNEEYNGVMVSNISFLQTRLNSTRNIILIASFSLIGAGAVGVVSYYVLEYDEIWIDILLGLCALLMIATLCIATAPVIWQCISWVMIKTIERSLWTLFVYSQRT
eukprot:120175_1